MKNQGIQNMFIIEIFHNVKRFGFHIKPSSEAKILCDVVSSEFYSI